MVAAEYVVVCLKVNELVVAEWAEEFNPLVGALSVAAIKDAAVVLSLFCFG